MEALPEPFASVTHGQQQYPIYKARLRAIPSLLDAHGLDGSTTFIVTDENVAELYLPGIQHDLEASGRRVRYHIVPPGEKSKSFSELQKLYNAALETGIDRQTPLLALGGGVVGDLAGFAAATLLRGIPLIHLPTSLIAQVDSSIGGKTGINHKQGKNLIGSFYQPEFVCLDITTVNTLPLREWTSGLAEVVKHGLIADARFFDKIVRHSGDMLSRETTSIEEVIPRAASIKAGIVERDLHEHGVRAHLNFGHTFGHALEKECGYGTLTHGEAVFLGMRVALHLSHKLHEKQELKLALDAITDFPINADPSSVSVEALMRAMKRDKKVKQGRVHYVLLKGLGDPYVTADIDPAVIRESWYEALNSSPVSLQ